MNENTPPGASSHDGPRVSGEQMRDLGRLRRSTWDKHVAGVSGGLARHLDIDPVIIRVAFVVLSFFGGAGLIAYAAIWLIVPDDRGDVVVNIDQRSRNVALIGVGVLATLAALGDVFGPGWSGWFPWPLLVFGLIAWVLVARRDRRAGAPHYAHHHSGWVGPEHGPGQPPAGTPGTAPYAAVPPRGPLADRSYYDYGRPRKPRKRGPILFWFTLALIALGLGTLGIVDMAGVNVIDSAYPALALAIIAVMLIVGAFYGRAGGLIMLGLVAAIGLSIGTVVDRYDGARINERPLLASNVDSTYEVDAGEIKLDLRSVEDLENLDGRTIRLDSELGRIELVVPQELTVVVDATVEAGGEVTLFGDKRGDWAFTHTRTHRGPTGSPTLTIEADIAFGEIVVSAR